MNSMLIFKYKNCIHIDEKLVSFEKYKESIKIDAQKEFFSSKAKIFSSAYTGSRLYLIFSVIISKLKIESVYFFIEETYRKKNLF